MKRVAIEFVALERKYEWSYAVNDKTVIDWLLKISSEHDVEITIIDGFRTDEIEILSNHKHFRKMRRPAINELMNQLEAA
jgi:hypothetical protein